MSFRKAVPILFLALFGCETSWSPPSEDDPSGPPTAAPDSIENSYDVQLDVLSYVCDGMELSDLGPWSSTAEVVMHADTRRFDLVSPSSAFGSFGVLSALREGDLFSGRRDVVMALHGREGVHVTTIVAGTLRTDQAAFLVEAAAVVPEGGGHRVVCAIRSIVTGAPRYRRWSGAARASFDGQWRVLRHVASDTAGDPPPDRYMTIDTLTQGEDGSKFDLRGPSLRFSDVPRAEDGAVDFYVTRPNQELFLTGVLGLDVLDLTLVSKTYDDAGVLLRTAAERYVGSPRFDPSDPSAPGGPAGSYRARFVEAVDTCTNNPVTRNDTVDVRFDRHGLLRLTLLGQTPPAMPVTEDGAFHLRFDSTDLEVRPTVYEIFGRFEPGGRLTMVVTSGLGIGPDGVSPQCITFAFVDGVKRYADYGP